MGENLLRRIPIEGPYEECVVRARPPARNHGVPLVDLFTAHVTRPSEGGLGANQAVYTPHEARQVALALLEAADVAEGRPPLILKPPGGACR